MNRRHVEMVAAFAVVLCLAAVFRQAALQQGRSLGLTPQMVALLIVGVGAVLASGTLRRVGGTR